LINQADAIRSIPLFSGLTREDLARFVAKLETQSYSPGQVIVKQGAEGDGLYILQSGAAEVVLEDDGARVENLTILGSGECFGEMALFTGGKRTASVIALADSLAWKLTRESWEELVSKHPTIALHFCRVLSKRIADKDNDSSKGHGSYRAALEEFFTTQPPDVQDFLLKSSVLKTLDPVVLQSGLGLSNADDILTKLVASGPLLFSREPPGNAQYPEYLRAFLSAKLDQQIGSDGKARMHHRLADYFASQRDWPLAVHYFLECQSWTAAVQMIEAHLEELAKTQAPAEILGWLTRLPADMTQSNQSLVRLKAETQVRNGDLAAAIDTYQEHLANRYATGDVIETAQYYQKLAELQRKKGESEEALASLRSAVNMLAGGEVDWNAVQAMDSIQELQRKSGSQEAAFQWGTRAVSVARKISLGPNFLKGSRKWLGLLFGLMLGFGIWQLPVPSGLDERGLHLLATLTAGMIFWVFGVFEEYIVALLMLLSWLLLGIASPERALAGFAKSSWFFILGVLGIGAAVTKSGLLYRVALQLLHRIPPNYKIYSLMLNVTGLLATPVLPEVKARIAIMAPISQAISETMGFKPQSNGSAGISLSGYLGFSQMTFVFLTGANTCILGWSLMPESARAQFGFMSWMVAALPAGVFTLMVLFLAVQFMFPLDEGPAISAETVQTQLQILGPLTNAEWWSIAILSATIIGWLSKPLHGIDEAWVALSGFVLFAVTNVLTKRGVKNNIDWGYLLFLGVITSLAGLITHLKLEVWLRGLLRPILLPVSGSPVASLILVALIVYFVRFYFNKNSVVVLLTLSLASWAQEIGIHPGVLLLVMLMAIESWFLPHQSPSYQIAYYSTDEKAFSHAQARKLMIAKFFTSLIAIALSVPYWRMLGFIR